MANDIIVYYEINSGNLYDVNGTLFGNNNLSMFLDTHSVIELHYVTEVTSSEIPSEWTEWTGVAGLGVSSEASIDDNYLHAIRGTLTTAIAINDTTVATTATIDTADVNPAGTITCIKADGTTVSFAYTSYVATATTVIFTLAEASTVAVATSGTVVRIPEALFMKTSGTDIDNTSSDTGIFKISLYALSHKLLNSLDYANTASIEGIFQHKIVDAGETINTFEFPFKIINVLDYDNDITLPSQTGDYASKTWALSFLNAPLVYQYSADGTNFHATQASTDIYYQQKFDNVDATWSATMQLLRGNVGYGYSVPAVYAAGTTYNPVSVSNPIYAVVLNQDCSWVFISSSASTGNAPPTLPTTSNAYWTLFASAGTDSYTYYAYASDASGTNFSLTPSNSLLYIAQINVNLPIATPTITDFASATWVKYLGTNGSDGALITLGSAAVSFTTTNTAGVVTSTLGTVSEDYFTITFTKTQLGGITDECEFDLSDASGYNISADSRISFQWASSSLLVKYSSGTDSWPSASWTLKPKGIRGRDGYIYDRVTVADNTITATLVPQDFYWTAVSAATLVFDFSAVSTKDTTILLKITMPSPVVSFTWPIITWLDGSAPDMSVAGIYWVTIHNDANGLYGNLAKGL